MALQEGHELSAAFVLERKAGLWRETGCLAERETDRDDGSQTAGQKARDGVVQRRHALFDAALLQRIDRAPAKPKQHGGQRYDDERHQRQNADAERKRPARDFHAVVAGCCWLNVGRTALEERSPVRWLSRYWHFTIIRRSFPVESEHALPVVFHVYDRPFAFTGRDERLVEAP